MNEKEAWEVLDGLMLGDGGLTRYSKSAYYYMTQSKPSISIEDHLRWEYWLRDNVFTTLGIKATVKLGSGTYSTGAKRGQKYPTARLWTAYSPLVILAYDEWYIGGEWSDTKSNARYVRGASKRLPVRIMEASTLSALTIAEWFLGDGNSSWGNQDRWRQVFLGSSTNCFTREEVYHLMDILENMGINTVKPNQCKAIKGSGLAIRLAQSSIDDFADLVRPHIMEVFGSTQGPSYKDLIKYRHPRRQALYELRKSISEQVVK